MWNGKYFVTISTPNGKIFRQDTNKPLPRKCSILATDNGMDRGHATAIIEELRAELTKTSPQDRR